MRGGAIELFVKRAVLMQNAVENIRRIRALARPGTSDGRANRCGGMEWKHLVILDGSSHFSSCHQRWEESLWQQNMPNVRIVVVTHRRCGNWRV